MRHLINIIIAAFLCVPTVANAQQAKKRTTTAARTTTPAKTAVATPPPVVLTQEEINFRDMLPSTAKITFVDSVVISKSALNDSLFLSKASGTVSISGVDSTAVYTFTNEFDNYRITSMLGEDGLHHLYTSSKIGTKWSDNTPLDIPGEYQDLICPFMLSDGTTLYFAALKGENNVGRHDIFMTIYDADDEKFITPQSLGLPFNSPSDDYYYLLDETAELGYLVTDRRQDSGKVCVYTFLPTETREIYEGVDDAYLRKYAAIQSIADTQTDKEAVKAARQVIDNMRKGGAAVVKTFNFMVTKDIVYHKITDFKSSDAKARFEVYIKRKEALLADESRLRQLRKNYKNGQTYTASEIENLETGLETERKALRIMETEIRKLELKR